MLPNAYNVLQPARGATLHQKVVVTGVGDIWRARGAQTYNRGLGAEPQVGSNGEVPWSWKVLAKQRQNLYIFFHKKKLWEKFQIARERVVVTYYHRHIQSSAYATGFFVIIHNCVMLHAKYVSSIKTQIDEHRQTETQTKMIDNSK